MFCVTVICINLLAVVDPGNNYTKETTVYEFNDNTKTSSLNFTIALLQWKFQNRCFFFQVPMQGVALRTCKKAAGNQKDREMNKADFIFS